MPEDRVRLAGASLRRRTTHGRQISGRAAMRRGQVGLQPLQPLIKTLPRQTDVLEGGNAYWSRSSRLRIAIENRSHQPELPRNHVQKFVASIVKVTALSVRGSTDIASLPGTVDRHLTWIGACGWKAW